MQGRGQSDRKTRGREKNEPTVLSARKRRYKENWKERQKEKVTMSTGRRKVHVVSVVFEGR